LIKYGTLACSKSKPSLSHITTSFSNHLVVGILLYNLSRTFRHHLRVGVIQGAVAAPLLYTKHYSNSFGLKGSNYEVQPRLPTLIAYKYFNLK